MARLWLEARAELVRKPCRIRDADPHLRPGLRRYAPGAVALAYRVFSRLSLCVVCLLDVPARRILTRNVRHRARGIIWNFLYVDVGRHI